MGLHDGDAHSSLQDVVCTLVVTIYIKHNSINVNSTLIVVCGLRAAVVVFKSGALSEEGPF